MKRSIEDKKMSAYRFYTDGDYYESLLLYNRLLEENPDDIYVLSCKGFVLIQYNRLAEAEELFRKALEISPKDAGVRCGLGEIFYQRGDFVSALNEYKKSLKYASDPYFSWIRMADCYYFLQKLTKAKKAALRALKQKPDCQYTKYLLEEIEGKFLEGEFLLADGCFEKAYRYLKVETAREKLPGKARLYLGMAEAILKKNVEFLNNAVKSIGDNLPRDFILANSGATKFEVGLKEEGLAELRRAVELSAANYNLIMLARRLGELPEGVNEAKEIYKRVLSDEPENFDALYGLAWLSDNNEEALELYRRAVKVDPDYAACHFKIGLILSCQRRFREAIQEFEEGRRLSDDNPSEISLNIAECFFEVGDFQKATEWAKKALFENPDLVDTENFLNKATIALEKQEKAN